MKTALAIGLAATLMTGVSSAAASECVNGYRMIREIPMPCGHGGYYEESDAPVYVTPRYERRVYRERYYDDYYESDYYEEPYYRTDIYEGPFGSWRVYQQPYNGPGYLGSYYHPGYMGSYYAHGPYRYRYSRPYVTFGIGFGW